MPHMYLTRSFLTSVVVVAARGIVETEIGEDEERTP